MAFAMPEDLGSLSAEDLDNLIEQATGEFNTLNESDDVSDETIESMSLLADGIDALSAEKTRRVEAAASKQALAARVPAAVVEAEVAVEETQVEAAVEEPVAEVEVETPIIETPEPVEAAVANNDPIVPDEVIDAPALVASGGAPDVRVPEAQGPQVVITAAADVFGFSPGQELDPSKLADALHSKARMLKDSRGRETVYPIATIKRPFLPEYDLGDSTGDAKAWDMLAAGTNPSALVAAGGWCAPSQIVYDLFEVECTNDSLFRLPTFRVTRGGIRWPVFVPHDETLDPGFVWTEEDDIDATGGTPTKPCVRIPCPEFNECRLDAVGLCITAGNLMDRAYPEQIRWFINRAVRAFERVDSIRMLNAVIADSVAVTLAASFGAASALISALLLQAADYRQVHGLCCGQLLDVHLPCWANDLVKADIARQDGTLSVGTLPSDAEVNRWFAAANLNVTFINHWQAIDATPPATGWPGTIQFLLGYPGSYLRFDGGELNLGVVRDSTLNETNDFTAVWFEQFYCVGRRGPQARIVTVPVCPTGEVGGRNPSTGEVVCPTS